MLIIQCHKHILFYMPIVYKIFISNVIILVIHVATIVITTLMIAHIITLKVK